MSNHDDRIYIEYILECVALIQGYTCNGKAEFMQNVLVQDAVLRRLQPWLNPHSGYRRI